MPVGAFQRPHHSPVVVPEAVGSVGLLLPAVVRCSSGTEHPRGLPHRHTVAGSSVAGLVGSKFGRREKLIPSQNTKRTLSLRTACHPSVTFVGQSNRSASHKSIFQSLFSTFERSDFCILKMSYRTWAQNTDIHLLHLYGNSTILVSILRCYQNKWLPEGSDY